MSEICKTCDGIGSFACNKGFSSQRCYKCKGSDCKVCKGTGKIIFRLRSPRCPICHGKGFVYLDYKDNAEQKKVEKIEIIAVEN